jgi:hypothetical protein
MSDEVVAEQQRVADVFLELGLIPRPIVVRSAVVPDFMRAHPVTVEKAADHNVVTK